MGRTSGTRMSPLALGNSPYEIQWEFTVPKCHESRCCTFSDNTMGACNYPYTSQQFWVCKFLFELFIQIKFNFFFNFYIPLIYHSFITINFSTLLNVAGRRWTSLFLFTFFYLSFVRFNLFLCSFILAQW